MRVNLFYNMTRNSWQLVARVGRVPVEYLQRYSAKPTARQRRAFKKWARARAEQRARTWL